MDLLTERDVEELTGGLIKAATLRSWRARHIGPPWFRVGPRRVAYRRADVLTWLAEQERERESR
jgi:predicted DNA-binding transcriptional regulator AlpA